MVENKSNPRLRSGFGERIGSLPVGDEVFVTPSKARYSNTFSAIILEKRQKQIGNPSVIVLTREGNIVSSGGGTSVERI